MMKIKKSKIIIITMLLLCFALSIMPMKVFAATEISKVQIGSVKYVYNVGDKPEATAEKYSSVGDYSASYYDIEYEYWEEMEKSATTGELEPVKFWYSDENKNADLAQDKSIITFEENKSYMYSISLKARDGYTFAENTEVYVNGKKVNTISIGPDGKTMFVTAIKTMQPKTKIYKHISEVEINNATISFKVGDKPVFSGTTPENVPYIYQSEFWSTDGGKKYYYAADFWNINNPDDLFTKFESGKSYTYGIYFKAEEGYCFTTDTKLKINGKYYDYDTSEYDPMLQYNEGEYATMWIHNTGLVITPTENSQGNPTTPSEPEKPSQEPVTPTTPTQETEKEPQATENKTEQTKNETNNPKTGDNIIISVILFITSIVTIVVLTILNRKKARE